MHRRNQCETLSKFQIAGTSHGNPIETIFSLKCFVFNVTTDWLHGQRTGRKRTDLGLNPD